jgi:heat shock protein HtpX
MWEAIAANRRRSWMLISVMGVLLIGLGFTVGMSIEPNQGGAIGVFAAVILWLVLWFTAVAAGDSILLSSIGARKIEKADAPQLWNVVEEMTIASGLGRMPAVYIIDDPSLNAFAVGRSQESACVAVTAGLLKRLNRDELQGVVAHEIGHIVNADVKFMTLAAVMVGTITIISDIFLRSLRYGGGRRRGSGKGAGQGQAIMLLVALVMAILAPLFARLLYLACSRRREYLADACGAQFTRYPEGLASALEKIAHGSVAAEKVNRAVAPLFIVNPLQGAAVMSLFSTHPPIDARTKILRSMAGAGPQAYEEAYRKVIGGKSRCLGEKTLAAGTAIPKREAAPEADSKQQAVGRAREVTDFFSRIENFIFLSCVCGMRIKIPPEAKIQTLACPRCGRTHTVPQAVETLAGAGGGGKGAEKPATTSAAGATSASASGVGATVSPPASNVLRYQRTGSGWESFRCSCGATMQVSPSFAGKTMQCRSCKREILID